MKKTIIVLTLLLVITGCSVFSKKTVEKIEKKVVEYVSLMNFDNFKDIVLDKIESIDYTRLTEAGQDIKKIIDKEEIKSIYNELKKKQVGKEVKTSCDDNTTIYTFNMGSKKTSIEIECDWIVVGNKRYEIK